MNLPSVDIVFLLSTAIALLAAGALWVVWLRDRRQAFARDVALWFLCVAPLLSLYPVWASKDPWHHWVGYLGIVFFFAAGHTFLILGVRRFAVDRAPRPNLGQKIGGTLFVVYALIMLTDNAVKNIGMAAILVTTSAGIYGTIKLWKRGRIERSIGILVTAAGSVNLIQAIGGADAIVIAVSLSVFIRVGLTFAFIFAALNRSAAHAERMLQRFEQLSEHSLQGIMVMDANRFYYLNPAVVAMFGYPSTAAMLASDPWSSTAPEERETTRALVEGAIHGEKAVKELQAMRYRLDGTQVFMRFSAWPVEWDGRPALQILASDETEKRRADMELQRAEEESHRIEEEHRLALIHLNAELERKVIERTKDLAQSNHNLAEANARMEHALETLRTTQAELVQREKLASLGRMVAGIAHELNTPIGNALTVGSTLRLQVRQLREVVDSGQLKKSTLTEFLANSSDGADLLESALHKAHALISNFRQVTKDHTDEPRSSFDLSALLESMKVAMSPGYENSPIALEFTLEQDIQVQSYPGHLTQLLTQLIDNARLHAFTGMDGGHITVTLQRSGQGARISVRDNGRGVPPDIRDKVFDPFFTTRLGGSVGLGLNTVYTVVTTKLGGNIQLTPVVPHGACFEVTIPEVAPVAAESAAQ